jgi:hypothetical protein
MNALTVWIVYAVKDVRTARDAISAGVLEVEETYGRTRCPEPSGNPWMKSRRGR